MCTVSASTYICIRIINLLVRCSFVEKRNYAFSDIDDIIVSFSCGYASLSCLAHMVMSLVAYILRIWLCPLLCLAGVDSPVMSFVVPVRCGFILWYIILMCLSFVVSFWCGLLLPLLLHSQRYLWDSQYFSMFEYVTVFYCNHRGSHILSSWMLGVFLLLAFTGKGRESQDLLSPCIEMHACAD